MQPQLGVAGVRRGACRSIDGAHHRRAHAADRSLPSSAAAGRRRASSRAGCRRARGRETSVSRTVARRRRTSPGRSPRPCRAGGRAARRRTAWSTVTVPGSQTGNPARSRPRQVTVGAAMGPTPQAPAWKDLCIDTTDPEPGPVLGRALGLEVRAGATTATGAARRATGADGSGSTSVPEPKTVKHRVHLDVHAGAIDDLVALGATVLPDHETRPLDGDGRPGGRRVLRVRPRATRFRTYRLYELVVDSADPRRAWRAGGPSVLGAELGATTSGDWYWLENVPGLPFEDWVFVPVPEPKTVKNRIHWDVYATDVAALLDARRDRCCGPRTTRSAGRAGRPRGQRVLRVPSRAGRGIRDDASST